MCVVVCVSVSVRARADCTDPRRCRKVNNITSYAKYGGSLHLLAVSKLKMTHFVMFYFSFCSYMINGKSGVSEGKLLS